MVTRHGEEYDWRTSDVDVGALYSSGGGKKHGRFSMLNGVIDTSGALSEARCSQSTQNSRGYQRQSQRETAMQEQIRQHEEAMQRQEEWARQQHEYMQGFFAQHRQIQVLCKFYIFSSLYALFIAIRYLIYFRFLGNASGYSWLTI
jgi:hypothetical protein